MNYLIAHIILEGYSHDGHKFLVLRINKNSHLDPQAEGKRLYGKWQEAFEASKPSH